VVKEVWRTAASPSRHPFAAANGFVHLTHGSSGPQESAPKTASRSVEPFLQGLLIDRHRDRPRYVSLRETSVALGRIDAMYAMRPNNSQ